MKQLYCGRYDGEVKPGLAGHAPFLTEIKFVPLSQQSAKLPVSYHTSDNVVVTVTIEIKYHAVDPYKAYFHALPTNDGVGEYYQVKERVKQDLQDFVYDSVRGVIPTMTFQEIKLEKEKISDAIKAHVGPKAAEYGYSIDDALITDITLEASYEKARAAEAEAKERRKQALVKAQSEADVKKLENETEADKIIRLAQAESNAQQLKGVGLAKQREAIIKGLQNSMSEFEDDEKLKGLDQKDIMTLIMMNTHYDTLKDMANSSGSSTIFAAHTPDAVASLENQIRQGTISANAAAKNTGAATGIVNRKF